MNYCSVCLDTNGDGGLQGWVLFLRMGYMHYYQKPVCDSTSPAAGSHAAKGRQGYRKRTGPLAFSVTYRHNGASTLTTLEVTKVVTLTLGLEVISGNREKASTFLSRSTVDLNRTSANWSCWTAHVSGATAKKKKKKGVNVLVNELKITTTKWNKGRYVSEVSLPFQADLPDSWCFHAWCEQQTDKCGNCKGAQ